MKWLAKAPWLPGMALALAIGAGSAGSIGCKQGEGEVCQINDDCQSGLVCNPGTMKCQTPGGNPNPADAAVDGTPAPDAPEVFDAAVDANELDAETADATDDGDAGT